MLFILDIAYNMDLEPAHAESEIKVNYMKKSTSFQESY